jgi:hypothetical protein
MCWLNYVRMHLYQIYNGKFGIQFLSTENREKHKETDVVEGMDRRWYMSSTYT